MFVVQCQLTTILFLIQEQYTILSQNPFESGLKRMSVLVHAVSKSRSEHLAFAKGAPEVIHGLCRGPCRPSEDILKQELSHWTKQGCRVLAIAYKRVKAESAGRINRYVRKFDINLHVGYEYIDQNKTFAAMVQITNKTILFRS